MLCLWSDELIFCPQHQEISHVCLMKEELHNPEETRRTRTWKPGSCSAELSEIEIWKLWHYSTFMHSCRPTYLFKFWFPILISIRFKLSYLVTWINCNVKMIFLKVALRKMGESPQTSGITVPQIDFILRKYFLRGPFLRKLLSVNNSAFFYNHE